MKPKEFDITLGVKKSMQVPLYEVVVGDYETNIYNIKLEDDGQPYPLEGLDVEIVFAKKDRTTVVQDKTNGVVIDDDTIKCTLASNTIAVSGVVYAEVRVLQDTKVLTSSRFRFYVRNPILNDNTVASSNEFPMLVQATEDAKEATQGAQDIVDTVQRKLDDGDFIGPQGDKGDTGEVTQAEFDGLEQELTTHLNDYADYQSSNNLKIASVERRLNDYKSTMANVNVNQEAKQSVSGYGGVRLPKNSANGQVSASVKGRTLKNELNYNRDTWVEWIGFTRTISNGYAVFENGTDVYPRLNANLKPNTKYGVLINVRLNTRTGNSVLLAGSANYPLPSNIIASAGQIGNFKSVQTTTASFPNNQYYSNITPNAGRIEYGDIRVFELPIGSEIENDFNTMTADQLAIKYPYIKGDNTKSTISASRLKSVDKDGIQESTLYLPNVGELRSLPNGVKDEIRVSGGKAELVKRVSATMEELAEPIITPTEVSGTLLSNPSGTVYVEPVVADAGIYNDGINVLHQDLPIDYIERLSKVDFMTGLETEIEVSTCVIAEDNLSFTHSDLTTGDIVFFTYYHNVEGTQGETTIEYYDSRHTLKDSVTGKFYKIVPTVSSGILTNTLVEV